MSDALISSFCEVTGANPQVARQFLEMSNNNVDRAVELYFSNPNAASAAQPATRPGGAGSGPAYPSGQQPGRPQACPMPGKTGPGPAYPPGAQPPNANDPDMKTILDDIIHHAQNQGPLEDPTDEKVEKISVKLWKKGFQVDDGDFRGYEDSQENKDFMAQISRGMIPKELYKPGIQIDVELDDNREKDYVAKPKPRQPFSGQSHSLGGPSPSQPKPQAAQPPPPGKTNFAEGGKPTTKVRIQMPDGQTVMFTVNTSATVGDIKRYIGENRSDMRGKRIKLAVTFPPTPLDNDGSTVEQAGIKMAQLNASLV